MAADLKYLRFLPSVAAIPFIIHLVIRAFSVELCSNIKSTVNLILLKCSLVIIIRNIWEHLIHLSLFDLLFRLMGI